PVDVTLADPITGKPDTLSLSLAHLQAVTRLLSYSPTSVSVMPLLIEQAAEGNYGPLAAQALLAINSLDDALSYGMHNAVACTEDAPYFDDFIRESLDAQAIADSYLGARQHESLATMCSVWPVGVIDADFKTPVLSDRPVLVLSGEADPVTPARNGERAIGENGAYLSNARHLIAPGQGHGTAIHGCMPQLIGAFVEAASHEGIDEACLTRLRPEAFFLDFSATAP
ncbi:MAG: alpha/beta hydrolase, partial [Pseudomonadota bacterium]